MLWLISAIIIISADRFSLRFDIPWFVLFSSVLTMAWFAKYKITGDRKLFFYEDIPAKHLAAIKSLKYDQIVQVIPGDAKVTLPGANKGKRKHKKGKGRRKKDNKSERSKVSKGKW